MFNVCYACGEYHADKQIADGPVAICPACGYGHPFRRLPLLLVGGASGAGKSTVCQQLTGTLENVVLLDADILWQPAFNSPEDNYRAFFETWLRMAKNIGQSGRPVVIFGAGFAVPKNLEPCVERRYFSTLHYLALTCDDDVLATRLRARPQWRDSSDETFVQGQLSFNHWLCTIAPAENPPVQVMDTSSATPTETAATVAAWIAEQIKYHK